MNRQTGGVDTAPPVCFDRGMEATTSPEAKTCGCGCGAEVNRRYRPGHDAKHKSALVRGLRSADWRLAWACAEALAELGWTAHAKLADLQAVPYRDSRGAVVAHLADVETFQVDSAHKHHSRRTCPALTAQARRDGLVNPTTKLANTEAVTLVPNSPELTQRLAHSWDQCTTCTTDHDRSVYAERDQHRQRELAA